MCQEMENARPNRARLEKGEPQRDSARRMELLSPAGSAEGVRAAFAAGADAVYVGGTRFGARAYAQNLDEEALKSAISYAHERGRKLYLTVNTLFKDAELLDLYGFLNPLYKEGLDAVIVQDWGVFRYVREVFPRLAIHASTQMGVTEAFGCRFLGEQGARRVVLARELSLREIRRAADEGLVEIECFAHGALCYCYSGQCLMSSLIGGRSGNRGRCAQPCRLPYSLVAEGRASEEQSSCHLSPKDLCTADILPELAAAGVDSLKIEGRMKNVLYAAGVTAIYRRLLDRLAEKGAEGYHVTDGERVALLDLFNRGGFTDGYAKRHNGQGMMAQERPGHFGVKAARVDGKRGAAVLAAACQDLHPGDVLEARPSSQRISGEGQNPTCTLGREIPKGQRAWVAFPAHTNIPARAVLYRMRNEALLRQIRACFLEREPTEKIKGILRLSQEKPVILELFFGPYTATAVGCVPQAARSHPVTADAIARQLRKTGGSGYAFADLRVEAEDQLFLPMQALNVLRREAIGRLKEDIARAHKREDGIWRLPVGAKGAGEGMPKEDLPKEAMWKDDASKGEMLQDGTLRDEMLQDGTLKGEMLQDGTLKDAMQKEDLPRKTTSKKGTLADAMPLLTVSLERASDAHLDGLCRIPEVSCVYLDCNAFSGKADFLEKTRVWVARLHAAGKVCWHILPWVFRDEALAFYDAEARAALFSYDGLLVRSADEVAFLRQFGYAGEIGADWNLYTANREAEAFWADAGVSFFTASPELNRKELQKRGLSRSDLIVYGYQPVMASAQCQAKNAFGCAKKPVRLRLRDRRQKEFAVKNNCLFCYNTIYNSVPLSLLGNAREVLRLRPRAVRLHFTEEGANEACRVACAAADVFVRGLPAAPCGDSVTKGHFERGVE